MIHGGAGGYLLIYIYMISPDSQVYLLPFRPCETTIQTFNLFLIWDLESQLNKNSHHQNACVSPSQLCCPTNGDKSSNSNLPAQVTDNVWCDWSQGNIRNNAKQLPSIDQIIFQVPPQMEMAFRKMSKPGDEHQIYRKRSTFLFWGNELELRWCIFVS